MLASGRNLLRVAGAGRQSAKVTTTKRLLAPRYAATAAASSSSTAGTDPWSHRRPHHPATPSRSLRPFSSSDRGGRRSHPLAATEQLIPGSSSQSPYGSLGEPKPASIGAVSWQAQHNADVQRVTQNAMIYELTQDQTRTIERAVPWFLSNMPASYFQQVPDEFRKDHIKAISAVRDANMDLYLNLKAHTHDGSRTIYTYIRPSTEPGTLLRMVEGLPLHADGTDLTRIHVFTALDQSMSLNMFIYGHSPPKPRALDYEPVQILLDFAADVQAGRHAEDGLAPHDLFTRANIMTYLNKCSDNYLNIVSKHPERFLKQRLLFEAVAGTEGCEVNIEDATHEQTPSTTTPTSARQYWVDVAMANSLPQVALEHTCRLLYHQGFDVARARLDLIPDGDSGNVTMLRMLVHRTAAAAASPVAGDGGDTDTSSSLDVSQDQWDHLSSELKRSKWLDATTMQLVFEDYPWLGVKRGELITAMCSLLHPILAKENAIVYSKHNILDMVTHPRMISHTAKIADLFLDKFKPENPLGDASDEFQARVRDIRAAIDSDVEESSVTDVLYRMIDIVGHTLKTNVYMQNRYALSLRLDPRVMGEERYAPFLPYGVVFVHGRRFNGYHCRFRDIARGGLRLVAPSSPEQLALESARQYDECYGLAFAQQLKNKDIPEGGSKAVCLIDTNDVRHGTRDFVLRKSVKAFTDSVLDLIVDTDETRECIVDYYGKREVLYLGPDENVTPEDINWIVAQAARRGYGTPAAFMSSKPRAGINHKVYGVTSEGVNVYLDVALKRLLGIDPRKEKFTVKMTGGPDGDVGGNEIKILIREYGDNVKIVGIADHSGCAEDPEGLNHDELLRLFREGLCISNFDATHLGSDGVLHTVDTEEGVKARNSMHNRLVADAFVPCGGRPNTIDANNYKQFLREDGTPSSKLIVEGANLFVTAEARQKLFEEAGVSIVKDSSANKGGVITSSYEICAAMLLSEDEFFENKAAIVEEVLAKLRGVAKLEAELLFREAENYGEPLPRVSQIISNAINTATDALSAALDTLSQEEQDQLLPLFRGHLPKTIADLSFDKVHERVPKQYIKNAIASMLASKMVYKEGTRFIDCLPKDKLAETALRYIRKEKEVIHLMETLETTDMSEVEKNKILELLNAGGARTALTLNGV